MVKGIATRKKTYVDVEAIHHADGTLEPKRIHWKDGRIWDVDKVLGRVRRSALKVGGTGVRYRVLICGCEKEIWYDEPRWFVEEIVPDSVREEYAYGNAYDRRTP